MYSSTFTYSTCTPEYSYYSSWDKDVALNFAITQIDVPNIEPVLFEMKLDTNLRHNPFAYISEFTPMNEEEVLLSMGFIFRIKSVKGRGRIRYQIGPLGFFRTNPTKFYIIRESKARLVFWYYFNKF
jgi:hypothetical protein